MNEKIKRLEQLNFLSLRDAEGSDTKCNESVDAALISLLIMAWILIPRLITIVCATLLYNIQSRYNDTKSLSLLLAISSSHV